MLPFASITRARRRSIRILSAAAVLGATLLMQPARAVADVVTDASGVTSALTISRPALNCVNEKLRAALKMSAALTACERHALATNTDPEFSCLNDAARQLGAAFVKIEAKGGCDVTGEATDVERLIRQLTEQVAQAVVTNTCQPSGAPCPGFFVACCAGQGCISRLDADPTCQ